MSFTTFQNEKTPFQAIKIRRSKSRRIAIFLKRLIHGFWTKKAFLTTSLFFQNSSRKCVLRYSRTKKIAFLGYQRKSFKSQKIAIFPKRLTHGFGIKTASFPVLFLRQNRPGKCLLRYCRTKKMPFQTIKTRKSKSEKIDIFPKGLTHGFGPKRPFFQLSFLGNIGKENVFYDILEQKKCLSRL